MSRLSVIPNHQKEHLSCTQPQPRCFSLNIPFCLDFVTHLITSNTVSITGKIDIQIHRYLPLPQGSTHVCITSSAPGNGFHYCHIRSANTPETHTMWFNPLETRINHTNSPQISHFLKLKYCYGSSRKSVPRVLVPSVQTENTLEVFRYIPMISAPQHSHWLQNTTTTRRSALHKVSRTTELPKPRAGSLYRSPDNL